MGKFNRALAGGIAGMAGAAGELFDDQIKNKEFDRREMILEKRQKTLASFRNNLALERDQTQYDQQDLVRGEARSNKELDQPSGKTLDGMPLSNLQLSQLSDEDVGRTVSGGDYKEGERAKDFGEKVELKQMGLDAQKEMSARTDARWDARYGGGKTPKPLTPAQIKLAKENALNDIRATANALGGFYVKENNQIMDIEITEQNKAKIEEVKNLVRSKGFNPTFSDVDGILTINLGGFDPVKVSKAIAAPEAKPTNTFDQLLEALNKQTGGSKMNAEQGNFTLPRTGGIAAPTQP